MSYDQILRATIGLRPPHGFASGDPTAWQSQAVGAASSAAFDITGGADRVVCVVFRPDVDCYLRCGPQVLGAATANDFPLNAGWLYRFVHVGEADRWGRVIRKSADGALWFYRASILGTQTWSTSPAPDLNDPFPDEPLPA